MKILTKNKFRFKQSEALVLLIIFSVLYLVTYQQFDHFNLESPQGASDARSYVSMAKGDYDVNPVHKYRFLSPLIINFMAGLVSSVESDALIMALFYATNFVVMSITALLLFRIFRLFGFNETWAIIGLLIFLSSRVVIYTTALPLVDSWFYLALTVIIYLSLQDRFGLLVLLIPLLILTKESIIPVLFLPFLNKANWVSKRLIILALSVCVAFLVQYLVRQYIGGMIPQVSDNHVSGELLAVIGSHIDMMLGKLTRMFSIRGWHDVFHAFSFFWILAFLGCRINKQVNQLSIPFYILLMLPLSILFALLSGNYGRMLFASYVVIIPYALVCIKHFLGESEVARQ